MLWGIKTQLRELLEIKMLGLDGQFHLNDTKKKNSDTFEKKNKALRFTQMQYGSRKSMK